MGNVCIRRETLDDYYAVEELTREAFWEFGSVEQTICDEHLLVHKLRDTAAFVPELSLVAELDGRIVGHIIYSKSKVVDDNGDEHELLTFGPLSVSPKYQKQGIGQSLMKYSFDVAKGLGFRAVIIFGHPDYYPRVGFRRAAEFGITTSDGKTFDPFMTFELYQGALDGINGRYFIDEVYEQLTQEEALEFDKRFPAKEAYVPVLIEVLLERLKPEARKEIESLNVGTLKWMKSKSERSVRALPNICDESIRIIKDVMREYGYAWGETNYER